MTKYKISGRNIPVLTSITETYDVSSAYRSGLARLTLSPDGTYDFQLTGDMSETTAKRNPNHKIKEGLLTDRMIKSYDDWYSCFTRIDKQADDIKGDSSFSVENNIEKQSLYQWKVFSIPKPTEMEIIKLVFEEIQNKTHNKTNNITTKENIEGYKTKMLEERISAWEEIQALFNQIETNQADKANAVSKREYDAKCQSQKDIIDGKDYVISDAFKDIETSLYLPFSINLEYKYSKNTGIIDIEIEIIDDVKIKIPKVYAQTKANGQITIKSKTQSEIMQDVSICEMSLIYYMTKRAFNISPNIKVCRISEYTNRKMQGICWISFDRVAFKAHIYNLVDNPLDDLRCWINVCNQKSLKTTTRFEPIDAVDFKNRIKTHTTK